MLGNVFADSSAHTAVAPSTNGRAAPSETKSTTTVGFFSPDSLRTIYHLPGLATSETDSVTRDTAFAAAVYAYAAMTWRAEKYSEPPLFVAELSEDDEDEWLEDHELSDLLDHPHPDLDMGELLYQTRLYRDQTGAALWVKDLDRGGRIGRLTPFHAREFEVKRGNGRMFGVFHIRTATGVQELPAERCVYFREPSPAAWGNGTAPLDVALATLNMGKRATATVKAILANALFPSVIVQTDPEWNPTTDELEEWQQALDRYGQTEHKGKPLGVTGGGTAKVVSMNLKDLIPSEILDRVESNVAAAFRVPPIVLQFKVGLENSPWSQMEEARRGVTQDLLVPMWTRDAKKLTAQLLRSPPDQNRQPIDEDRMHYVRFSLTSVAALEPDRIAQAEMAKNMENFARIKDLRQLTGLEPLDDSDPRNDEIPGQIPAASPSFGGAADEGEKAALPGGRGGASEAKAIAEGNKRDLAWLQFDIQAKSQEPVWQREAFHQLSEDRRRIAELADIHLAESKELDEESRLSFLEALEAYLKGGGAERWRQAMEPLIAATGESAVRRVGTALGISFELLQPGLIGYTEQHAAQLVTQVSDTTRKAVADAVAAGVREGEGVPDIARRIRESDAAFGKARSELIARTETTQVTNQSQRESLSEFAGTEDVTIEKTWLSARDDRVRPEHAEMDGKTVEIDASFPNGRTEPGEPNCRCTLLYDMED